MYYRSLYPNQTQDNDVKSPKKEVHAKNLYYNKSLAKALKHLELKHHTQDPKTIRKCSFYLNFSIP